MWVVMEAQYSDYPEVLITGSSLKKVCEYLEISEDELCDSQHGDYEYEDEDGTFYFISNVEYLQ